MEIKFKLFGFTDIVDENQATVALASGSTLQDALQELSRKCGEDFRQRLFDTRGQLHDHIRVVTNGCVVEKLTEKLEADATVFVLHEIAGGCL